MLHEFLDKGVVSILDKAAAVQSPLIAKYANRVRDAHYGESTEQIVGRLERHYLIAVTASGVAVGLSAAVPGVGTLVGLAAGAADTVLFLEASTVLTVGAATVHEGAPTDARRGHLVSAVVLGKEGTKALGTAGRSAKQWDMALADKLPVISRMDDSAFKRFVVQFVVRRGALMFGKVIPAGVGAVVGGVGNHALGRSVITNLHDNLGLDATTPSAATVDAPLP